MVSRADGDAFHVQDLRDVVGMQVAEVERDDAGAPLGRRAVELDPRNVGQLLQRVHGEVVLVLLDRLEPGCGDVVDGGREPHRLGDRLRARLELRRHLAPGRLLGANRADHVPAEVERLHLLQQVEPPPECADARRPAQLVRREREEIAPERLHVDRPVRRSLGRVDDHDRALLVGPRHELLDGIDGAQRVGDEVRGHDLHVPLARERIQTAEVELPLIVERNQLEAGTRPLGDVLPGDEVRVVLELGDDHEVAGPEVHQPPGVGDEVQALGRVSREDDLLRRRRVDEAGHGLARALVGGGCPLGELVDAAVHVRVGRLVELPQRVEHLRRLLRRRGRVEVGERLPVDLLLEDGEIGAKLARVELGLSRHSHLSIVLAMSDQPGGPEYSLVVPIFNEEQTLSELVRRLRLLLDRLDASAEVVLVDDGSSDGSYDLMVAAREADSRFKVLRLSRNFGHQIAITAGMDVAAGNAVIVMDADLQDPPEVVLEMAARWREGFDIIYGVREARPGETRFKKTTASAFYRLLRRISNIDVPLDVGDFRLVDRRALEAFKAMRETNRYVRGMFSWIGFRQVGVSFQRDERFAGDTKYHLTKMVKFATDGVVSFSAAPLRLALNLGFIVSALSFTLWTGRGGLQAGRPILDPRPCVDCGLRRLPRRHAVARARTDGRVHRSNSRRGQGPSPLHREGHARVPGPLRCSASAHAGIRSCSAAPLSTTASAPGSSAVST